MLTLAAEKLLSYFNRYKISSGDYFYHLAKFPKAEKKGDFASAFNELLETYGYTPFYA